MLSSTGLSITFTLGVENAKHKTSIFTLGQALFQGFRSTSFTKPLEIPKKDQL